MKGGACGTYRGEQKCIQNFDRALCRKKNGLEFHVFVWGNIKMHVKEM